LVGVKREVKQLNKKKINALLGLNYTLSIRSNILNLEFNYSHTEGMDEIKKSHLYKVLNGEEVN
jgi:hypothetical protein